MESLRRHSNAVASLSLAVFAALWLAVEGSAIGGRLAYSEAMARFGATPWLSLREVLALATVCAVAFAAVVRARDAARPRAERATFALMSAVVACALLADFVCAIDASRAASSVASYEKMRTLFESVRGVLAGVGVLSALVVVAAWNASLASSSRPARAAWLCVWGALFCAGLNLIAHYAGGAAFFGAPAVAP